MLSEGETGCISEHFELSRPWPFVWMIKAAFVFLFRCTPTPGDTQFWSACLRLLLGVGCSLAA
jgi:hypothetical protein